MPGIACQTEDGRDRSLSQKKPGFNYLLLPKDREDSQMVPELTPEADDIVVLKTTDSALTGTNLRLLLRNMEIDDVIVAGIFTDGLSLRRPRPTRNDPAATMKTAFRRPVSGVSSPLRIASGGNVVDHERRRVGGSDEEHDDHEQPDN